MFFLYFNYISFDLCNHSHTKKKRLNHSGIHRRIPRHCQGHQVKRSFASCANHVNPSATGCRRFACNFLHFNLIFFVAFIYFFHFILIICLSFLFINRFFSFTSLNFSNIFGLIIVWMFLLGISTATSIE